jgi:hypothetical protein
MPFVLVPCTTNRRHVNRVLFCTGQKIHSFHNLAKGLHVCAYIRYPIKAERVEIANKHVGLLLFGTHCKKLSVAHASFVAVTEL